MTLNAPPFPTLTQRALIRPMVAPNSAEASTYDWELLLPATRLLGLSGRLAVMLGTAVQDLPPKAADHIEAARRVAGKHRALLAWEIERIGAALAPLAVPVILLKGAGYLARNLPPSRGRFASDIDILVPRDRLKAVEDALLSSGWQAVQSDEYDQRYFRDWMHEIPPLRHLLRNTTVDVHHTLLPPTSRLNHELDPALLFAAAIPVGIGCLATLSPIDMVLHSAAHRFSEGEQHRALRDLIDIHDLVCHFGATIPSFWEDLELRARQLRLERPLYYAVRYCRGLLDTPVPKAMIDRIEAFAPPALTRAAMDALFMRVFLREDGLARATADWVLYSRGHYLRMPWKLLIPHLTRKWTSRHLQRDAA